MLIPRSQVRRITAQWERFFEWKRIEREDDPRRLWLEVMLHGTQRSNDAG